MPFKRRRKKKKWLWKSASREKFWHLLAGFSALPSLSCNLTAGDAVREVGSRWHRFIHFPLQTLPFFSGRSFSWCFYRNRFSLNLWFKYCVKVPISLVNFNVISWFGAFSFRYQSTGKNSLFSFEIKLSSSFGSLTSSCLIILLNIE